MKTDKIILDEAYERGKVFASIKAANVLKENGFSNDFISSVTGLSETKIENLWYSKTMYNFFFLD